MFTEAYSRRTRQGQVRPATAARAAAHRSGSRGTPGRGPSAKSQRRGGRACAILASTLWVRSGRLNRIRTTATLMVTTSMPQDHDVRNPALDLAYLQLARRRHWECQELLVRARCELGRYGPGEALATVDGCQDLHNRWCAVIA